MILLTLFVTTCVCLAAFDIILSDRRAERKASRDGGRLGKKLGT